MEIFILSSQISTTPVRFRQINKNTVFSRSKTSPSPYCRCSAVSTNFLNAAPDLRSNRLFILGMGFVGQFVAEKFKNQGWDVSGSCTSTMKKKKLEERGFDVHLFDANDPELRVLNILKHYTHLIVSIPPAVVVGDPLLWYGDLLRTELTGGSLQWLCYLSSTSVYGNCGGEWVYEDYPANPTSELSRLRLVAEDGWLNLGDDLALLAHIFRLGGIYGPGRSAVDTIIKQKPYSESQNMRQFKKYTSRIHVEDIYQALVACIHNPSYRKVYNIVDDNPAPREEVYEFARNLLEKKWPGQISRDNVSEKGELVPQKRSSRDEKRVSNIRMKTELGVKLLHPDYRSGLKGIIDCMENPF